MIKQEVVDPSGVGGYLRCMILALGFVFSRLPIKILHLRVVSFPHIG